MAADSHCLKNIDIIILAGGQGTRIRDALGDTPKLLAPVSERPFLELLICRLKKFGARRVVITLGHLADKVLIYLDANPPDGIEIVTSVEQVLLGTAGSIRFARSQTNTNPVMVLNGDSFFSADLCKFVSAHQAGDQVASILCAPVNNTARFGRLDISDDGRVLAFLEKDTEKSGPGVINAGGYLFSTDMLDTISCMPGPSLEHDVFEKMPPGMLGAIIGEGTFIDIGTPDDLVRAASLLAPYI
jgi:NDP-sugar pyrophosphorylase family protein